MFTTILLRTWWWSAVVGVCVAVTTESPRHYYGQGNFGPDAPNNHFVLSIYPVKVEIAINGSKAQASYKPNHNDFYIEEFKSGQTTIEPAPVTEQDAPKLGYIPAFDSQKTNYTLQEIMQLYQEPVSADSSNAPKEQHRNSKLVHKFGLLNLFPHKNVTTGGFHLLEGIRNHHKTQSTAEHKFFNLIRAHKIPFEHLLKLVHFSIANETRHALRVKESEEERVPQADLFVSTSPPLYKKPEKGQQVNGENLKEVAEIFNHTLFSALEEILKGNGTGNSHNEDDYYYSNIKGIIDSNDSELQKYYFNINNNNAGPLMIKGTLPQSHYYNNHHSQEVKAPHPKPKPLQILQNVKDKLQPIIHPLRKKPAVVEEQRLILHQIHPPYDEKRGVYRFGPIVNKTITHFVEGLIEGFHPSNKTTPVPETVQNSFVENIKTHLKNRPVINHIHTVVANIGHKPTQSYSVTEQTDFITEKPPNKHGFIKNTLNRFRPSILLSQTLIKQTHSHDEEFRPPSKPTDLARAAQTLPSFPPFLVPPPVENAHQRSKKKTDENRKQTVVSITTAPALAAQIQPSYPPFQGVSGTEKKTKGSVSNVSFQNSGLVSFDEHVQEKKA